MKKLMQGLLAATLLVSLSAGMASAASPSFSVGLSNTTVFGDHVMGIGGAVNIPFGANGWAFNVDGRFEFGNYKEEDPPAPTGELKVNGFRVRGGVDHGTMVGQARVYIGTGVSYASHDSKVEIEGSPDIEFEPYKVFGISSRVGGSVPLGADNGLEMFVQIENTLGWGSLEDGSFKLTQTDSQNGAQVGLLYRLPSN